MNEERKPAGRGDLRRKTMWSSSGFMLGGQSTGQIDVHRANGTLPTDRYAEYVSGMAHRVIG